jgi:ATP-dependent Clp protease ATP-binding subunit ClpC
VFERFSGSARHAVLTAQDEAVRLGHSHVGTEHLLLGLLSDGGSSAGEALSAAGATYDGARKKVGEVVPRSGAGRGKPPFSARAKRALDRAERFCLQARAGELGTAHVLRGVLDVEGTAGQVLRGLGVDVVALQQAVQSDTAPERSVPVAAPAVRCPGCGADLASTLSHRTLTARGDSDREVDVTFCDACGTALGATPG